MSAVVLVYGNDQKMTESEFKKDLKLVQVSASRAT